MMPIHMGNIKTTLLISTNADEAGAPRHVETLALSMLQSWRVCCVFGENGPVASRLRSSGVDVYVIPQMRNSISPLKDIFVLYKLIRLVIRLNPDILHCHSSKAGMLGRLAAVILQKPCIYTVHGWGWRGMSAINAKIIRFAEAILSLMPNCHYIYVSNSVKKEAQKYLAMSELKGTVIYNGVSRYTGECAPNIESHLINIIMPARVCNAKDHKTILAAFERLPLNYKLCLCGSGTDTDEFISYAREIAPHRHMDITFIGETSRIYELYERSDIFVLTSHFEALPISIIEAMSLKLPVVATDVGGVSELVVDQCTGYLIPRDAPDVLLDRLLKLSSFQTRRALGRNGNKIYLERFTETAMIHHVSKYYSSILSGKYSTRSSSW